MNHKHATTLILALALGGLILSCADSESRMPLSTSTAVIQLAHPDSPLASRAGGKAAATVPATFSSVQVVVSGADIGTIQQTFPYADTITMDVPAGVVRHFQVTAFVAPYNADDYMTWSAAATFKGEATANVPSGATVSVPVYMIMDESRFVIPDYSNNRIVQFETIQTAADTWLTSQDVSNYSISTFNPVDLKFDARGRIYILARYFNGSYDNICRVDNIMAAGYTTILDPAYFTNISINAMAIDKSRNLLYFADSYGTLRQADLGTLPVTGTHNMLNPYYIPATETQLFSNIIAMDVDTDGMLYIIAYDSSGNPLLIKYNPLIVQHYGESTRYGDLVGAPFNFATLGATPLDVQLHGGAVAVLTNSVDGFALIQFQDTPAGFIPGQYFGTVSVGTPPQDYNFYGPDRFAVRRENMLVIIDEGQDNNYMTIDRLVLTEFGVSEPWDTFGTTGSGVDQFRFYSYC